MNRRGARFVAFLSWTAWTYVYKITIAVQANFSLNFGLVLAILRRVLTLCVVFGYFTSFFAPWHRFQSQNDSNQLPGCRLFSRKKTHFFLITLYLILVVDQNLGESRIFLSLVQTSITCGYKSANLFTMLVGK